MALIGQAISAISEEKTFENVVDDDNDHDHDNENDGRRSMGIL